jgi:protein arginine kinase activator
MKGVKMSFDKVPFSIVDLLASLSGLEPSLRVEKKIEQRCKKCNMSFEDFKQKGRLGCSECYNVFAKQLQSLLKRIHGYNQHTGKSPFPKNKKVNKKDRFFIDIQNLKKELSEVIKTEEYEKAAMIRDKIKEMEKKLSKKAKGSG